MDLHAEPDAIDFGDLPEAVNALLQQGVVAYRHDHARADALFRQALQQAPAQLPVYFCLYKIHTYLGNLEEAEAAAENGLREAAEQAGWDADWRLGSGRTSPGRRGAFRAVYVEGARLHPPAPGSTGRRRGGNSMRWQSRSGGSRRLAGGRRAGRGMRCTP